MCFGGLSEPHHSKPKHGDRTIQSEGLSTVSHILITGAGTGFGKEVSLRLAEAGHSVIAGVEIIAQVTALRQAALDRGVQLRVEKLDITNPDDRAHLAEWDINVLLNNAGVSEGGSTVDIPEQNLRHQFDVNVFAPVLLTQIVAKSMIDRGSGLIVFMSSVAGLTTDPFTGAYSASKHAVEAFADALYQELAEFGVRVATINPGPYLTGFNDTMFERPSSWNDDSEKRTFDYEKLVFPHEQFDPEEVYATTVRVLSGEDTGYRHVLPAATTEDTKAQMNELWERRQTTGSGPDARPDLVQTAYDMEPATPVND